MRDFFSSFKFLSENEIQLFESALTIRHLKKGDYLIKEGQISHEIAFVSSGILRSYYHSASGEEVTYCFSFENSFTGAYTSFISQTQTELNIQALTDSVLFCISGKDVRKLERASYNWLKFFKIIAESEFVQTEKRIFQLQRESAQERYLDLLKNHPEFLQTIPLTYLASYLGITPRHLSRIRRSVLN